MSDFARKEMERRFYDGEDATVDLSAVTAVDLVQHKDAKVFAVRAFVPGGAVVLHVHRKENEARDLRLGVLRRWYRHRYPMSAD